MIVAPDTVSMSALCAFSVSATSFGTAAVVCGWFGCCSIFTAVIFSPEKVTWTCTGPFSVWIVVPLTAVPDEEPAEEDGVAAGSAVEVAAPTDGS
ncbi:hypothetical protein GCM10010276_41600 [Streptomyces longisporus]|uniref:Secreted protein n=1 Tax=Streptomyces longisporus TaxID=1948 RepID=A0ABP5ZDZ7_STRLO